MPDKVYRRLAELERRARRGSFAKFKAAMAMVSKAPPMPGDELPD